MVKTLIGSLEVNRELERGWSHIADLLCNFPACFYNWSGWRFASAGSPFSQTRGKERRNNAQLPGQAGHSRAKGSWSKIFVGGKLSEVTTDKYLSGWFWLILKQLMFWRTGEKIVKQIPIQESRLLCQRLPTFMTEHTWKSDLWQGDVIRLQAVWLFPWRTAREAAVAGVHWAYNRETSTFWTCVTCVANNALCPGEKKRVHTLCAAQGPQQVGETCKMWLQPLQ